MEVGDHDVHVVRSCRVQCRDKDAGGMIPSRSSTARISSNLAIEEPVSENSCHIYGRLRISDSEVRILLQKTNDEKTAKERMHLDLETDDVEAEVSRLEALGATRWDHQVERGFDFWVLRDPWGNEFCVLRPEFPEFLARQEPWNPP